MSGDPQVRDDTDHSSSFSSAHLHHALGSFKVCLPGCPEHPSKTISLPQLCVRRKGTMVARLAKALTSSPTYLLNWGTEGLWICLFFPRYFPYNFNCAKIDHKLSSPSESVWLSSMKHTHNAAQPSPPSTSTTPASSPPATLTPKEYSLLIPPPAITLLPCVSRNLTTLGTSDKWNPIAFVLLWLALHWAHRLQCSSLLLHGSECPF